MFKRVFLLVIDGLGVGETKDATDFGDTGANTFLHTIDSSYNLDILEKLGLTKLVGIEEEKTRGLYMKASPINKFKDSLNGHYEMMCAVRKENYMTYPEGFPLKLITEIKKISGRDVIGNISSDGVEIINELGEMHMQTGSLIVYTSADSVLQIAAHEDIVSPNELYKICEKVFEIASNKYNIARVIARPFNGKNGEFVRTNKRKDFACDPPINAIDLLNKCKVKTFCIGKIGDMFNHKSIYYDTKTTDDIDTMLKIINFAKGDFEGLVFANLNDCDTLYGHRRDKKGFLKCLEEFNFYLPVLLKNIKKDDLLIITADHGNDPTFKGFDHTREYVPILIYSPIFKKGKMMQERTSLADIGATILDNFGIDNNLGIGKSIFDEFKK